MLSFAALFNADKLIELLFFSIIHELSHLIVLLICGGKPESLKFSFYGMALKYQSNISKTREFFVIVSGPAVNLLLYCFLKNDVNLLLFVLNIFPVYPLDGGRILKLSSLKISKYVSVAALLFLFAVALYSLINYKSFSLLLIAVYLAVFSINY